MPALHGRDAGARVGEEGRLVQLFTEIPGRLPAAAGDQHRHIFALDMHMPTFAMALCRDGGIVRLTALDLEPGGEPCLACAAIKRGPRRRTPMPL